MKKAILIFSVGVVTAACGPTRPPNQLTDARVAYQRANIAPGAALVPGDLHAARGALDAAERSFSDDGSTDKTKTLAYVAQRQAITAQAKAGAADALEQKRIVEAQFMVFKEQHAIAMRAQLDRTKTALSGARREAEAERLARTSAEAKTQDLLLQIQGLKTSQSQRGLVVTISGSVLFASGKSQLLPAATARLSDVAKAVKDDKRSLLVVGYTDSQGSEDANMRLSEARAKAVRTFLMSKGVDESRIRSEGMGEGQPVADNASPEGRANNRRVEIILENNNKEKGAQPAPPSTQGKSEGGTNKGPAKPRAK